DQFVDSTAGAADSESLSIWPHRNVQTVLRYVDANDTCVHLIPSLRNRASQAAQATVRVRWNGRRRPLLTHGLGVPKGRRSSACHRTANPSRTGNAQVTRGLSPRANLSLCACGANPSSGASRHLLPQGEKGRGTSNKNAGPRAGVLLSDL